MGGNDRLGSPFVRTGIGGPTRTDVVNDAVGGAAERLSRDPSMFDRVSERELFDMDDFGQFHRIGLVWVLSCDNAQTNRVVGIAGTVGNAIAAPAIPVMAAISAACAYIKIINEIGGSNGVDIHGVVGTPGVVVTPRWSRLFEMIRDGAAHAVTGQVLTDLLLKLGGTNSTLANALNVPAAAAVVRQIAGGTPLGWALAGALGYAVDLLMPAPDINDHGAVMADRGAPLAWEKFWMVNLEAEHRVALLYWEGYLSAQMGGGHGVYANRPAIGPWERWTLHRNGDGTVSLETDNHHFLCAEEGGGRECQANRPSIGEWEKFWLEGHDGQWALRTFKTGQFVSVQA